MIGKETYKHTQTGWAIIITISIGIVIAILAFLVAFQSAWFVFLTFLTAAVIIFIWMFLFSNLTVIVNDNFVQLKFGVGLIRKSFKLKDIKSCTIVRNLWWYGWGIHWFPHGVLFNISGLDAIELLMNNGKVYRIGTDEPKKLNDFIQIKLKEK